MKPLWRTVLSFLKKLKMGLLFDPVILYPRKPETLIRKDLCTPLFIAAQLTIAKSGNWPGPHHQMTAPKTVVHLHHAVLVSSKKKNLLPFHTTQMDLDSTMLNEVS